MRQTSVFELAEAWNGPHRCMIDKKSNTFLMLRIIKIVGKVTRLIFSSSSDYIFEIR